MDRMIRYLFLFICFWIILAERIQQETIIIGTILCLFIYFFNKRLILKKSGKHSQGLIKVYYFMVYLFILVKEIILANFQVAKTVLSPRLDISPQVINFNTKLKEDLHKTILANSITLTPGTLTVVMEGNKLIVHCLKKDYIEDVLNSKFEKILLKIEE